MAESRFVYVTYIRASAEQVISALMPFRGSFYEHFGYGIAECRCTWTVPRPRRC